MDYALDKVEIAPPETPDLDASAGRVHRDHSCAVCSHPFILARSCFEQGKALLWAELTSLPEPLLQLQYRSSEVTLGVRNNHAHARCGRRCVLNRQMTPISSHSRQLPGLPIDRKS